MRARAHRQKFSNSSSMEGDVFGRHAPRLDVTRPAANQPEGNARATTRDFEVLNGPDRDRRQESVRARCYPRKLALLRPKPGASIPAHTAGTAGLVLQ